MRTTLARLITTVALGVACALVGASLGINHAYDRLAAELPAMIEDAGCITAE